MSSSAQVIIIVQDFNDEPPTFDLPLYAVDVCHMNGLAGTSLVKPVAVDRDSGINAQINYIILVRILMCTLLLTFSNQCVLTIIKKLLIRNSFYKWPPCFNTHETPSEIFLFPSQQLQIQTVTTNKILSCVSRLSV